MNDQEAAWYWFNMGAATAANRPPLSASELGRAFGYWWQAKLEEKVAQELKNK